MKQISTFFIIAALAVAGVGWVLVTDTPFAVESRATGYRGVGMAVVADAEESAALARVNTIPEPQTFDIEPLPPEPGEPTISELDTYQNVEVLGDLTEANFLRFMAAITEWVSPEQGCVYCHNEEGNFAAEDNYAKRVSRRMIQMTRDLNVNWQNHLAQTGVTCYTCHRGNPVPRHIWFRDPRPREGMMAGADRSIQNRPTFQNAWSSLPTTAVEDFLSAIPVANPNEPNITAQDAIRVQASAPREPGGVGTKAAEHTYGLMMYVSQSLGVNCTYCHNTRGFQAWDQSTPQRTTAFWGIDMTRYINAEYLVPLAAVYPPARLGPLGDPPKAACQTCHQGVPLPLGGMTMLTHWPELRTEGAPVYE